MKDVKMDTAGFKLEFEAADAASAVVFLKRGDCFVIIPVSMKGHETTAGKEVFGIACDWSDAIAASYRKDGVGDFNPKESLS